MVFTTFEREWPWIGLGAAVVLALVLFATNALREDVSRSRWRDPAWLAWLGVAIYMFHNFEEYGVAANGVANAFPADFCRLLGLGGYPGCPIPPDFYLYVNITLVWVVAPLCALLARRHVMFGFVFYGVILINTFLHAGGALATRAYDPGLVTALLLFLPASLWAGIIFLKHRPKLGAWRAVAVVALGVLAHGTLVLTVTLFIRGIVSAPVLNALQIVNSVLLLVVGGLLQASLRPRRPVTAAGPEAPAASGSSAVAEPGS